jgi:hypothetical protein
MTQIRSYSATEKPETFRQGATAFQHSRDLAKEWRDGFIEDANGRVLGIFPESQSFASSGNGEASISMAGPALVESDTSADETEAEYEDAPQ